MKIELDVAVEEVGMLMLELAQHMNFFDSLSTRMESDKTFQLFDQAQKIEVFMIYIFKHKSKLFREIPQANGAILFFDTNLSGRFNPYDFLFFQDHGQPETYFPNFKRFSLSLQLFVNLLFVQNQNSALRTLPTEFLIDAEGKRHLPQIDSLLPWYFKKNANFFVDNLREAFYAVDFQKKIKAQLKKTNAKYRDYCGYIDALFEKNGDLTFVTLELTLLNNGVMNLLELKTKFLNNARNVDPFSRAIGYVGKWEWSTKKGGLYFRIIFIFPTPQIGDIKALQHDMNFYWCETITHGQGLCHHAHIATGLAKFKKSFCHIKSNNLRERDHFKKRVIGYITKSEKYYCPTELITNLSLLMIDKSPDRTPSLTFRSKSK